MLRDLLRRFGLLGPVKSSTADPVSPGSAPPPARTQPFHAVRIICSTSACQAAKDFGEQRFLTDSAPKLPLQTCDAPVCDCKYEHYPDRRDDVRRLSDSGAFATIDLPRTMERRKQRGRRKDDLSE